MVTVGLVIAAVVILGALLLALGMLGALWFGTQAASPPDPAVHGRAGDDRR
jgi:hypothetical protein